MVVLKLVKFLRTVSLFECYWRRVSLRLQFIFKFQAHAVFQLKVNRQVYKEYEFQQFSIHQLYRKHAFVRG